MHRESSHSREVGSHEFLPATKQCLCERVYMQLHKHVHVHNIIMVTFACTLQYLNW